MKVDLYFGFRDQLSYKLGETYRWTKSPLVKNGGRPPNGTTNGEGYTECPHCKKDFFVIVNANNDKLESVMPDTAKKPYIPD